jgi:hypothetical protein
MCDSNLDELMRIAASTKGSKPRSSANIFPQKSGTLRGQLEPYSSDQPRMSEANVYKFFETVMDEKYRTDISDMK